jgi:signal transduction histidine kinase
LFLEPGQFVEGVAIAEVCWEFFGLDAVLEKILKGELADFYIPDVNRTQPDGTVRYFDFNIMPLHIQKPGRGLLLIVEDVTREGELDQALVQDRNRLRLLQDQLARANEELKRLNQLKSVFLSMAAHDLRTPLTAIQGYVELGISCLETGEEEELKDFLPAIQTQIDRLQHLIGDVLDLNMIEQGKLSIYPMPCLLADVVDDSVKLMGEYIERQGLHMNLDLAQGIQVLADPSRLRQVLYNLLSNAVKYGASGGEIYLQTWADDQNGYLQVRDRGSGIAAEDLPYLFQLFYRAGGTPAGGASRSHIRGTGVGLYIVKFLVEAQEGSVQVNSEIGKGSAFTVGLPLAR